MSISQHLDRYLAEKGIEEVDEVVPDSECQVFDGKTVSEKDRLEKARTLVAEFLQ